MTDRPKKTPRSPAAFSIEPDPLPEAKVRQDTPSTPRSPTAIRDGFELVAEERDPFLGENDEPEAGLDGLPARRKRRFPFGRIFATAFGIVVSVALGLWIDSLIRTLFQRADWLGWAMIGVVAIGVFALLVIVLREIAGLMRLDAVETLRLETARAAENRNPVAANAAIAKVTSLLAAKPETAAGRKALKSLEGEIIDGPGLIEIAETELLFPLDREARTLILNAAKRVSVVTAVSPRALVDLGYVVFEVTKLVRAMAMLYGGRPGTFGMIRLLRDVLAHLAVTGTMAAGDELVQQLVGHGLAARLSARLGEGVVNGLMTARIGIAAMDLCRPMPFRVAKRPRVGDFISDLARLTGRSAETKKDG